MFNALIYIYIFASLTAIISAMESPIEEHNHHKPKVQLNTFNHPTYGYADINFEILEYVGIANCVEVNHVSNLELVCKSWYDKINHIFTVIKKKDLLDISTPLKLKDNSCVKHLVITADYYELCMDMEVTAFNIYCQVIQEGLKNKPKLKTLTCGDVINVNIFLGFTIGMTIDKRGHRRLTKLPQDVPDLEKYPPADFLKLEHLTCFTHLEQFVTTDIESNNNWPHYFKFCFMAPNNLPNLKLFRVGKRTFCKDRNRFV